MLINSINGLIRNPIRLIQLERLCKEYKILLKYPEELKRENGWISGFFDADGTITINKNNNQLSISISQKTPYLLEPIKKIFKGEIYIDNSKYQSFKWWISKRKIY